MLKKKQEQQLRDQQIRHQQMKNMMKYQFKIKKMILLSGMPFILLKLLKMEF